MGPVFIFEVQDIDSDWWVSEVAVVAETRQEALRRIRDAGLHKKQIENGGRPTEIQELGAWKVLSENPAALLRRRGDCDGWGQWEQVPEGVSLDWRISGEARRAHPQR
ncbi:hypothetical protein [Kribbella catacumbae]|uniref:hypothetical protein n=1 Tax=Kribbella catacumbae TaxID=460086 RepID=UPI00037BE21E|nr:hypothetical protein [Kribbella catacumbae]